MRELLELLEHFDPEQVKFELQSNRGRMGRIKLAWAARHLVGVILEAQAEMGDFDVPTNR